jgi:flagellar L-ring protein precursor FlgH
MSWPRHVASPSFPPSPPPIRHASIAPGSAWCRPSASCSPSRCRWGPDAGAACRLGTGRPDAQHCRTSNRRSYAVGDIIKVVVDEYALASANKDNTNSASRRRKLDIGANPPSMGTGAGGLGAIEGSLEAGDGSASNQRGNATRGTPRRIAVRVVAVTPDGLLQVKGTKLIDVDKNKQTLTLAGFVRPLDLDSRDVVASDNIADIQLAYASKGSLGKPKSGIISRIVGLLWP